MRVSVSSAGVVQLNKMCILAEMKFLGGTFSLSWKWKQLLAMVVPAVNDNGKLDGRWQEQFVKSSS